MVFGLGSASQFGFQSISLTLSGGFSNPRFGQSMSQGAPEHDDDKLYHFGRNAGFIRRGIQSHGPAAA
jgi:hypothetical protein